MQHTSTIQNTLQAIAKEKGHNLPVSLEVLSAATGVNIQQLVSLLTVLEHQDEIKMEISTKLDSVTGEMIYSGTVQLMEPPPDEVR